jgi:hypothetical protein
MAALGYGAVLVDQPVTEKQYEVAGAVITGGVGCEMASGDDPRFVILSHPAEPKILAGTGYSRGDLLWQGRYVAARNVVCRRCGTVFPRRRLAAPAATGCLTSLGIGVAGGLLAGVWWGSIFAGFVAWYVVTAAALTVVSTLASLYVRLRYAERAASLAAERFCPTCGADDSVRITEAKSVTCPSCRGQSLRFVMVGIS